MNTRGRVREALKKSLDSVISKSSQEKNSEYLRRKRYKENDRSIISSPNKNEYQKKTKKSAIDSISDIKENSHKLSSLSNDDSFVDNLMHWRQELPPGTGFRNLGNTCFLNSVLQCILYTAPLKNYFDLSDHSSNCKIKGVCFICEYGKLSHMSEKNKTPITPQNIIQNIKNIAHHIKIGRQEDAHEFLLYFISAMENSAIKYALSLNRKFNKFKNPLIEENLIQKIFGGTITSSVTCGKCKHSSNKIDKFIDISLVYIILTNLGIKPMFFIDRLF